MLISLIVIFACLLCLVRTVSYGVALVKEKNVSGAVSVFFLSLLVAVSVFFTV